MNSIWLHSLLPFSSSLTVGGEKQNEVNQDGGLLICIPFKQRAMFHVSLPSEDRKQIFLCFGVGTSI